MKTIITWRIAWTVVKLAALCLLVGEFLRWNQSTLSRWLIACAVVLGTRWIATRLQIQRQCPGNLAAGSMRAVKQCSCRRFAPDTALSVSAHTHKLREQHKDNDAWRKLVGNEPVAAAWDKLCNSIIQEFIYDSWFSQLSPDREFPAEVRCLLNHAFGQFSRKAKRVDWTPLLVRSCSSALCHTLRLYREAVCVIGAEHLASFTAAEADAAIRKTLTKSQKLHPAFATPEGQYKTCRHLAELLLTQIIPAEDRSCDILRTMLRELLATCLIRSILVSLAPYSVNRMLLSLLQGISNANQVTAEQQKAAADHEFKALESCRAEKVFMQQQRVMDSGSRHEAHSSPTAASEIQGWPGIKRSKSLGDIKDMDTIPPVCSTAGSTAPSMCATSAAVSPAAKSSISRRRDVGSNMQGPQRLLGGVGAVKAVAQHLVLRSKASSDIRLAHTKLSAPDIDSTPKPLISYKATVAAPSNINARKAALGAIEDPDWSGYDSNSKWPQGSSFTVDGSQLDVLAQVVNAELHDLDGKDCIVYKVHVVQYGTEWTVTRRYRHFEALHKRLKDLPGYEQAAALLPSKQPLTARDAAFVLRRREELNNYLQALLHNPFTASNPELQEFISQYSHKYRIAAATDAMQELRLVAGQIAPHMQPDSNSEAMHMDDTELETSVCSDGVLQCGSQQGFAMHQRSISTTVVGQPVNALSWQGSFQPGSNKQLHTGNQLPPSGYFVGGASSPVQQWCTEEEQDACLAQQLDIIEHMSLNPELVQQSELSTMTFGQHSDRSSVFAGAVAAAHAAVRTDVTRDLLTMHQTEALHRRRSQMVLGGIHAGQACSTCEGRSQDDWQPPQQMPTQQEQKPETGQASNQHESIDNMTSPTKQDKKAPPTPDSPPVPNKMLPELSLLVGFTQTSQQQQGTATYMVEWEGKGEHPGATCSYRRCTGPPTRVAAGHSNHGGCCVNSGKCIEAASGRELGVTSGYTTTQASYSTNDRQLSACQPPGCLINKNSSKAYRDNTVTALFPAVFDGEVVHGAMHHGMAPHSQHHTDSCPGQQVQTGASSTVREGTLAATQHPYLDASAAATGTYGPASSHKGQLGQRHSPRRHQQDLSREPGSINSTTAVLGASGVATFHSVGDEEAVYLPVLDRNTGLIEPLCELLSMLFELKAGSFVRRPVISMMRQLLSLLAGGAVDEFLQRTVSTGLSAESLSRQLSRLHRQLFPGGLWFARAAAAASAAAGGAPATHSRGPPVDITKYLDWVPPADCDAIAEQLRQELFAYNFPTTMIAVVGKTAMNKALSDCYGVLQSKTLMYNLGLTLLETVLEAMFPELKLPVERMHKTLLL